MKEYMIIEEQSKMIYASSVRRVFCLVLFEKDFNIDLLLKSA